jgi:hypothetical protein
LIEALADFDGILLRLAAGQENCSRPGMLPAGIGARRGLVTQVADHRDLVPILLEGLRLSEN